MTMDTITDWLNVRPSAQLVANFNFNFPQAVWKHKMSVVGYIIWVLFTIYFPFKYWKNFQNWLVFKKLSPSVGGPLFGERKGRKGKEEYVYSTILVSSQTWITQFYLQTTPCLPFLRKCSPNGATRLRQQTSKCSLLLIYQPRKDERLSRPGWLTYSGRFTRVRTIPSWTPNTQYPILWYLTIPIPNTNTNTGSGVICCTDSLQITTQISIVKGYRGSYKSPRCEIWHFAVGTSNALLTIFAFTKRYSSPLHQRSPQTV